MSLVTPFFGIRKQIGNSWDPSQRFSFNNSLSQANQGWYSETGALANIPVDWKETSEAHVFQADLPGVEKEEVKVEVKGRILQISGQRSRVEMEMSDTWHQAERSSGRFLRRFLLLENDAKLDQVRTSMENGVLTVTVPKEEVKKPDVKVIEISG